LETPFSDAVPFGDAAPFGDGIWRRIGDVAAQLLTARGHEADATAGADDTALPVTTSRPSLCTVGDNR